MSYVLISIWLFITLMLFTAVFMYGKALEVVNRLVDQKKRRQRRLEIDKSIEFLNSKLEQLDQLMDKLDNRKARRKSK